MKTFVLDTNVILHDSQCYKQFGNHNVVIPIVVIKELDRFKTGNNVINQNAREFIRNIDEISTEEMFNGGALIGQGKGRLSVRLEKCFHSKLHNNFDPKEKDHKILSIALHLVDERKDQKIVLVTKDVNLRLQAGAVGLSTEDYKRNTVDDLANITREIRVIEGVADEVLSSFYTEGHEVKVSDLPGEIDLLPNECIILRNALSSVPVVHYSNSGILVPVKKDYCASIKVRNDEQKFAIDILTNPDIPLVTLTGKAGTGKTLLALAAAIENRQLYRQIFIARPIVPLSNKDIGFLPGDIESKLNPYMQPIYDNLSVIAAGSQNKGGKNSGGVNYKEMINEEKIVITPLSYIRGRSVTRVFFIVDEAQNLTPHEVKTIITRAGEGTKIVFTGDIFQIDHPYLDTKSNGLSFLIDKVHGKKLFAHVNLLRGERSELSEMASILL
jgi:PhoH-like ATPase